MNKIKWIAVGNIEMNYITYVLHKETNDFINHDMESKGWQIFSLVLLISIGYTLYRTNILSLNPSLNRLPALAQGNGFLRKSDSSVAFENEKFED